MPSDAVSPGYKLLHQGGFIRKINLGEFVILPLGVRVLKKLLILSKENWKKFMPKESRFLLR